MITSFFPGRIRLRAPVFKDKILVEKAIQILKKFPALKNLEHNPLTGNRSTNQELEDWCKKEKLLPQTRTMIGFNR